MFNKAKCIIFYKIVIRLIILFVFGIHVKLLFSGGDLFSVVSFVVV